MPRLPKLVYCVLSIALLLLSGCAGPSSHVPTMSLETSAPATSHLTGSFTGGVPWQYSGGVLAGQQHGDGEMIASNGWRFKGTWLAGRVAQGTMTYANGDIEIGNFLNGQTTLKQAINGLESIRSYADGKMVKSEGSDLQTHLQAANYDKAYVVHGRKPILGMEFLQNQETLVLEVVNLVPNAPAQLAGIRAGDRIVQFAGIEINDKMQFLMAVQTIAYGTQVTMRVDRAGQALDLQLTPSIRPDGYTAGLGMVASNSYEELFQVYLADLGTFDERLAELDLPPEYRIQAQVHKQHHITSLKAGQTCGLVEEMWVYQGTACKDALAHGKGSAVHLASDLRFVGEFNQGMRIRGIISASGVEMYDGPIKDGRPDGAGICFHEGEPEECNYYRGKRADAVYKQRIAMARQRQFIEEQPARQQAQIDSLRNDVKNTQFAIQQSAVPTSGAGLQPGMGDILMDSAKRKAADKVMDAVFDKLF